LALPLVVIRHPGVVRWRDAWLVAEQRMNGLPIIPLIVSPENRR
jgi:hypothetical protein